MLALVAVACAVTPTTKNVTAPLSDVAALFSDVTSSTAHRYDLKDSQGAQMACVHVYAAADPSAFGGDGYFGVYQSFVSSAGMTAFRGDAAGEFEVRLASSSDLMTWTFRRTLLQNADMPFIARASNGWLLLAHEQWMNPGSQVPSRLGFKLFYNERKLVDGEHFNSFIAPLSVGKPTQIEGTPSIYQVTMVERQGYQMLDAAIGFHFNNEDGIDQVAAGTLHSFGPSVVDPSLEGQRRVDDYDDAFIAHGAIGNIGQRDAGTVNGVHLCVQEGNTGKMPPTIWQDWRVWLYLFAPGEGATPLGAPQSSITELDVKTHGGSTAFGNPSFAVLPCPSSLNARSTGSCLFVSYFCFSEGAAPGEAGVAAFVQQLA